MTGRALFPFSQFHVASIICAGLLAACGGSDPVAPVADLGPLRDLGPLPDGSRPDAGNPTDLSCLNMIPLRLWTTDPSAVAMLYRIETCAGETVIFDPATGESVFDYYTLTENGSSLSSEAVPDVDLSGAQRAYVTLLLDFSSSTRSVEAELLAAARSFVEALLGASDRAWVGIQIFDGRLEPVTIQRPTPDLDELRAAIAGLSSYSDPLADEGSTNLNGAIASSVPALQAWQETVMARNDRGLVASGYVVAFTDGRDTSERVTTATAATAVATARRATGIDGELANVQSYAVALRSPDFTAEARASLLTILGGDERSLYEGSLAELSAQFDALAQRIAGQADATHLLKYCSAARSGAREVEFGILPSRGGGRNAITFSFSADGFAPGCADFIETICVDRECGGFNCGGCDDRTESCVVGSGQCVSECVVANQCTGEMITTALGYTLTCSAELLGPTVRSCSAACVDTASNDNHCGTCGNVCETLGGAGERCVAGACVCPGGGEVCTGSCRAPSSFTADDANCGSCGNACGGGASCAAGSCVCPGSQIFCDAACRDASYFASTSDCGTCGNACSTSGELCVAGSCECPSGDVVCTGACRSPSYFTTSANCGSCEARCTGPCATSACVDVAEIETGGGHTCARLTDGTVRCWGYNSDGQLADGTRTVSVSGLAGVVEIAMGISHSCARLGDGTVRCWGDNAFGQLGDGTTVDRSTPVAVSGLTGAVEIATGTTHSCARLIDGTVRCWGQNTYGRLGDGTEVRRLTQVTVSGLSSAAQIAIGDAHSCARLTDGTVRCWGSNANGQVGDGTTTPRLNSVAVSGVSGAVEIATGSDYSCARLTDGTVRCWGFNVAGQLGDGTTTQRLISVAVSGLTSAVEIATGVSQSCARLTDGTVRCWGNNGSGQLGDGTTTIRLTPVAVSGLTSAAEIATGGSHSCARLTDATVRCWGNNNDGRLGDGTVIQRVTPVSVVW